MWFLRLRFLIASIPLAGILIALGAPAWAETPSSTDDAPPNILFIAIDDLRNDLGALGVSHAHTPHLDQFARSGRLFSRHYTQVPTCGPSRAALLSGLRPSGGSQINNNAIVETRDEWGEHSLPKWFRQHGYQTLALGKISHYPGGRTGENWREGPPELPGAWDRSWVPESPWETPRAMMHGYANGRARNRGSSPMWEAFDGPDTAYPDAWIAEEAIEVLDDLARNDQPWFFAVGFFKPHLPFAAPKTWFDLHDAETIPVPPNTDRPSAPSSWHPSAEALGNYKDPAGRDPREDETYARELRHAYAAATSYMDAQLGRVLERLQALGLADNTIVVIWSDHGFCLGEHATWGKHSLYEESLRSPLIIRYPDMPRPGEISDAIVETIDLFPTLTDLSGLPRPVELDGRSLMPQLHEPSAPSSKPALAWYRRQQISIRTDDWRLIAHRPVNDRDTLGLELFDFRRANRHGVPRDPAQHAEVVQRLMRQLEGVPTFD